MPAIVVDELELTRSICRESYYAFLQEMWDVVIQQKPVWNWHIPFLCDLAQAAAERVFANKPKRWDYIFNVPPGSTKSTIFSVAYLPWIWTRMPTARFIGGSHTFPLALDLSRKSRDIIRSEKYKRLFPEVVLREDLNAKGHFGNTAGGTRYAVGVGGSVTGMHAHFLGIDDPLDPEQAASDEEIKIANRWMSETLPSRKVDKEVSVSMLVMQRLHQIDPSGYMLEKGRKNIMHICIPAEETNDIKPVGLRANYVNGLMDPVRLSRKVLDEAHKDLQDFGYACQFLQTPIPKGGGTFKTERLRVLTQSPPKYDKVARYWDKAGTDKGGDFTVGVKMGRYTNPISKEPEYVILDVVRGQWDSNEREKTILETTQADGRTVVVGVEQEPGSGGKESAEATAKRLSYHAKVEIIKTSGDKTVRADEFSKQVNGGAVGLAYGLWIMPFVEELKYFPNGRYDDQVDAASGAFSLVSRMPRRVGAL